VAISANKANSIFPAELTRANFQHHREVVSRKSGERYVSSWVRACYRVKFTST